LPTRAGHCLQRRPDLLRLPGLRGHQLHRRRPPQPGPQPAPGDVPGPRHHHRPVHPGVARGVRDPDGAGGDRQRRHRPRGGGPAGAGGGRLRHDGGGGAAGHLLVGERQPLRRRLLSPPPPPPPTRAGPRQSPPVFGQRARVGGTRGLVISVGLVLLLANLVDLTAIASLGRVVALGIFLVTSLAALRLRRETNSSPVVIGVGIAATALVLVIFAIQTLRDSPGAFAARTG